MMTFHNILHKSLAYNCKEFWPEYEAVSVDKRRRAVKSELVAIDSISEFPSNDCFVTHNAEY